MSNLKEKYTMNDRMRKRMQERNLQFDVPANPLTVIMEDDIQHTAAFPVCDDPNCICYSCERERIAAETAKSRRSRRVTSSNLEQEYQRNTAPLNGNRPFRLMR
jgi:hypothetical protein